MEKDNFYREMSKKAIKVNYIAENVEGKMNYNLYKPDYIELWTNLYIRFLDKWRQNL